MKYVLIFFGFLFITAITIAQPGNTPGQKKPPSAEELKKRMEEAMKKMTPEQIEQMKKMGFDKAMENVKKMDGKQLQEAIDNANRPVPIKDVVRIASISQKPLTSATIDAQLTSVHAKVITVLKPAAKQMAENIYAELKLKYDAKTIGNAAVGLWMMGKNEMAMYLMGKTCIDDPANTDNISNYAAMLSMNAGEHLALPFLNYLNTKFPNNSTILNNIGQAWFGLGEIAKAEKYIDSTIRIYAWHPQANFTKSAILESKGETVKAVEAAKKSIKHGYTTEKEDRLRKLKYKLKPEDLSWDRPMPQDPLGLEKFVWPDYPKSVKESETLKKAWEDFKKLISQEKEILDAKLNELEPEVEQQKQQRWEETKKAAQRGLIVFPFPPLSTKAAAKLSYLIDDKDGSKAFAQKKQNEAMYSLGEEIDTYNKSLSNKMEEIREKYKDRFGEGKENPFAERCSDENAALNAFLSGVNTLLEQRRHSYLEFIRKKTNDEVYYNQYTQWEDEFEVTKLRAKTMWLSSLREFAPIFYGPSIFCQNKEEEKPKSNKLSEFDDVACKYNDTLDLEVIEFINNCSRMKSRLKLKFFEYERLDDFNRAEGDTYIGSTVKVSAEKGISKLEKGPLKVEVKVGASVELEFDRGGIKDVRVGVEAKVGAGHNTYDDGLDEQGNIAGKDVVDTTIEAGVEGKISIISGKGTFDGTGILNRTK